MNLKTVAQTQVFTTLSANESIKALLCNIENLPDEKKRKIHDYQVIIIEVYKIIIITYWKILKLSYFLY